MRPRYRPRERRLRAPGRAWSCRYPARRHTERGDQSRGGRRRATPATTRARAVVRRCRHPERAPDPSSADSRDQACPVAPHPESERLVTPETDRETPEVASFASIASAVSTSQQESPLRGGDGHVDPVRDELSGELARLVEPFDDPVGASVAERALGDAGFRVDGPVTTQELRVGARKDAPPTELRIRGVAEPD